VPRVIAAVLLILMLASMSVNAQWRWSHPVPQANDLWSVSFAGTTGSGWAVGAAGIIIKSTDGGTSWSVQESGREDILRGICAVNISRAWAVGDNGVVLTTTTGGASWYTQNSTTTAGINTIYANSVSQLWFVGDAGMLHSTTNGGLTWVQRSTGTTNNLNGVHFTDALNGVAVGAAATILQSTDGGVSWSPRSVSHGMMYANLIDVFFVDAQFGWAVGGAGTVIRTTNGGQTWSRMNNNGTTADLNKVRFADRQNGWAVGEGGAVYRSTNGGMNWTQLSSGTTNGLEGLSLTGSGIVAVGLIGDILSSSNGSSFGMVTSGPRASLNAVSAAVPSSAWAVGSDGIILHSANGGSSWQQQNSGTTTSLFGVDNIGGHTVVTCGNGGILLRSTNGGQSWQSVASGTTVSLNAVELLDSGTGYIVGSSGRILKTTNSGAGWYPVASGTLESLFGVHFTDDQHGTVVGSNGTVFSTTNGGFTWTHQQSWTQDALFHVIREGNLGMLCGDDGTVSRTTDGGISWSDCITGTTAALFRLTHPSPGEYAAVGENGVIMRTSDFGLTWVREMSHDMHTLFSADAHGGTVYAVGEYGSILRNTSYPYPVDLLAFSAIRDGGCIRLRWETENETSLYGFAIERRIDGTWKERGFSESGSRHYEWNDCAADEAENTYRLRMIDLDGTWEYSPTVTVTGSAIPQPVSMECYPQPSSGDLTVLIHGAKSMEILHVCDMSGRRLFSVRLSDRDGELVHLKGELFQGAGTYVLVLEGQSRLHTQKITVLR